MWWPSITLPPFTGCHVHDLRYFGKGLEQPNPFWNTLETL